MTSLLTALTNPLVLAAPDALRSQGAGPVAEIVRFRLAEGTGDAAFLDAARKMQPVVATAPGFVSRRMSKGDDGVWTDHLVWTDLAHALAAPDVIFADPAAQAFGAAIDPASVEMRHEPILFQTE